MHFSLSFNIKYLMTLPIELRKKHDQRKPTDQHISSKFGTGCYIIGTTRDILMMYLRVYTVRGVQGNSITRYSIMKVLVGFGRDVWVCMASWGGVHVNEQENTRRVVNNRFNECVKAGGSVRACRVKQTHQIRLSKCKVVSFQFAPTPSFLLGYFLPCLLPPPPPVQSCQLRGIIIFS